MQKTLITLLLLAAVSTALAATETWFEVPRKYQFDAKYLEVSKDPKVVQRANIDMGPEWFSAHVDFYQPVLKQGFRGLLTELHVSSSAPEILRQPLPIERDLWHAEGVMSHREGSELTEPYTELKILFPYGRKQPNTQYLVSTLPDADHKFPDKAGWKLIYCNFSQDPLTEDPSSFYLCSFRALIHPDILAVQLIQDENLSVAHEMFQALEREVIKWRLQ